MGRGARESAEYNRGTRLGLPTSFFQPSRVIVRESPDRTSSMLLQSGPLLHECACIAAISSSVATSSGKMKGSIRQCITC